MKILKVLHKVQKQYKSIIMNWENSIWMTKCSGKMNSHKNRWSGIQLKNKMKATCKRFSTCSLVIAALWRDSRSSGFQILRMIKLWSSLCRRSIKMLCFLKTRILQIKHYSSQEKENITNKSWKSKTLVDLRHHSFCDHRIAKAILWWKWIHAMKIHHHLLERGTIPKVDRIIKRYPRRKRAKGISSNKLTKARRLRRG